MILSAAALPPLGLAHFSAIEVEPAALVEMAARIGYAAVGFRLYPAFPGAPFYELPAGSAAMLAMRSRLADLGVTVWDIEFVTVDEAFDPDALKPLLESAAELGARRVSICGADPDPARFAGTLGRLADTAALFGIGIDLEVMPWRQVSSLALALDAVRVAARPNLGILVDALHLSRSGGDPEDLRAIPAAMIRSAQLCDAPAERPATDEALIAEARGGRSAPGEGALPLPRLLAALPDHVVLSLEVPNRGDPPEAHARRIFEAARRMLAATAGSA